MTSQNNSTNALAKIITFNDILCPLIIVIAKDIGIVNDKESCDVETLLLAKLVENVMDLTNRYIGEKKITNDETKWAIAINLGKIVAANYKKTDDIISSEVDLSQFNLEKFKDLNKVTFKNQDEFKNCVFETISNIVNSIDRFHFATDKEKIITTVEKQISIYADNLFKEIDRDSIDKEYFNGLYIKTMANLAELFNTCYYNGIDAILAVPHEKREKFIQKHMVDSSDSIEKTLDGFFARVSIISNISISLNVPLKEIVKA